MDLKGWLEKSSIGNDKFCGWCAENGIMQASALVELIAEMSEDDLIDDLSTVIPSLPIRRIYVKKLFAAVAAYSPSDSLPSNLPPPNPPSTAPAPLLSTPPPPPPPPPAALGSETQTRVSGVTPVAEGSAARTGPVPVLSHTDEFPAGGGIPKTIGQAEEILRHSAPSLQRYVSVSNRYFDDEAFLDILNQFRTRSVFPPTIPFIAYFMREHAMMSKDQDYLFSRGYTRRSRQYAATNAGQPFLPMFCLHQNSPGVSKGEGLGPCPDSRCMCVHRCLLCGEEGHGWFDKSACGEWERIHYDLGRLGYRMDEQRDALFKALLKVYTPPHRKKAVHIPTYFTQINGGSRTGKFRGHSPQSKGEKSTGGSPAPPPAYAPHQEKERQHEDTDGIGAPLQQQQQQAALSPPPATDCSSNAAPVNDAFAAVEPAFRLMTWDDVKVFLNENCDGSGDGASEVRRFIRRTSAGLIAALRKEFLDAERARWHSGGGTSPSSPPDYGAGYGLAAIRQTDGEAFDAIKKAHGSGIRPWKLSAVSEPYKAIYMYEVGRHARRCSALSPSTPPSAGDGKASDQFGHAIGVCVLHNRPAVEERGAGAGPCPFREGRVGGPCQHLHCCLFCGPSRRWRRCGARVDASRHGWFDTPLCLSAGAYVRELSALGISTRGTAHQEAVLAIMRRAYVRHCVYEKGGASEESEADDTDDEEEHHSEGSWSELSTDDADPPATIIDDDSTADDSEGESILTIHNHHHHHGGTSCVPVRSSPPQMPPSIDHYDHGDADAAPADARKGVARNSATSNADAENAGVIDHHHPSAPLRGPALLAAPPAAFLHTLRSVAPLTLERLYVARRFGDADAMHRVARDLRIPPVSSAFAGYYLYRRDNRGEEFCPLVNGPGGPGGANRGVCFNGHRCTFVHRCLLCDEEGHGWYQVERCKQYAQYAHDELAGALGMAMDEKVAFKMLAKRYGECPLSL